MAKSLCAVFVDDAAVAALQARVPNANVNSGMFGSNCGNGIGISTENPDLSESLPSWTLLDQHGNARVNQIGQLIGGLGISNAGTSSGAAGTLPEATIRLQDQDDLDGTGELSFPAPGAELSSLATGWEAGA